MTLVASAGAGAQSPAPPFSAYGTVATEEGPPASAIVTPAGAPEKPPASPISFEASLGREYHSSPLLRIDENGPLILIDGLTRLDGNYGRVKATGLKDWSLGSDTTFAVSGYGEWKRSPSAPDLDFGNTNFDAMIRHPFAGASLGVGTSVGRMWVSGGRFRDSASLRADLAKGDGDDGHWAAIAEFEKQNHAEFYSDLDARAASLLVSRHFAISHPVVKGVDLEGGYEDTRNSSGFQDLSSRALFARLGVDLKAAGLDWSFGLMAQQARYRQPTFEGDPARRDRFYNLDVNVSKDFSDGSTVQLAFTWGRNLSNLEIYDTRFREVSLTYAFGR